MFVVALVAVFLFFFKKFIHSGVNIILYVLAESRKKIPITAYFHHFFGYVSIHFIFFFRTVAVFQCLWSNLISSDRKHITDTGLALANQLYHFFCQKSIPIIPNSYFYDILNLINHILSQIFTIFFSNYLKIEPKYAIISYAVSYV